MKQGTINHLKVKFKGIEHSDIYKIAFAFSQVKDGPVLKEALYDSSSLASVVAYDSNEDTYSVPFSREDTYKFLPDATFYMDTRIYTPGSWESNDNPVTPIVALRMHPTLFAREGGVIRDD